MSKTGRPVVPPAVSAPNTDSEMTDARGAQEHAQVQAVTVGAKRKRFDWEVDQRDIEHCVVFADQSRDAISMRRLAEFQFPCYPMWPRGGKKAVAAFRGLAEFAYQRLGKYHTEREQSRVAIKNLRDSIRARRDATGADEQQFNMLTKLAEQVSAIWEAYDETTISASLRSFLDHNFTYE
jgi:hypothetical protein